MSTVTLVSLSMSMVGGGKREDVRKCELSIRHNIPAHRTRFTLKQSLLQAKIMIFTPLESATASCSMGFVIAN